jgi:hypothetical protein
MRSTFNAEAVRSDSLQARCWPEGQFGNQCRVLELARYLLFLKYDQSTEDYSILMGYELAGNEVYRLDELNEKDGNYSQIAHLLRGEGTSESQFLVRAGAAFLSQKRGN